VNIALWVVQGLLAAAYLAAGLMKLLRSREQMVASGSFEWAKDMTDGAVKAIGAVEVLGALGVVLPAALHLLPVLTPVAAVGLFLMMAGATVTHARRGEKSALGGPVVLGLVALAVAVLRFGPYPV